MNRRKLNWTCSYCSKIFKDPIELPCKHNLCKEHLNEKDVLKRNKIECAVCQQFFQVKSQDFNSNDLIKKFLQDQLFLSDEEISLKEKIEESIQVFYDICEKFCLNKTSFASDVHNHIQEIRFQLDEHREILKKKIDVIYMEMIEKTKKFELRGLIKIT
jgi:hypothetical protein